GKVGHVRLVALFLLAALRPAVGWFTRGYWNRIQPGYWPEVQNQVTFPQGWLFSGLLKKDSTTGNLNRFGRACAATQAMPVVRPRHGSLALLARLPPRQSADRPIPGLRRRPAPESESCTPLRTGT